MYNFEVSDVRVMFQLVVFDFSTIFIHVTIVSFIFITLSLFFFLDIVPQ